MTAFDDIQPSDDSRWGRVKNSTKSVTDYDAHAAQSAHVTAAPLGTPHNPNSKVLTLANAITFCRLCLTIAFLWLFVRESNRHVALVMYGVAAATDFLDGFVARSTQSVSWLGKIMDPVIDRFLLFSGVLGLVMAGYLPVWVAAFLVARDAYLAAGGLYLQRYRRRPVDVSIIGKVTTALLMVGFCDLLLGVPSVSGLGIVSASWLPGLNDQAATAGIFLVYVGVVTSFVSAVLYTFEGAAIRKEPLSEDRA